MVLIGGDILRVGTISHVPGFLGINQSAKNILILSVVKLGYKAREIAQK